MGWGSGTAQFPYLIDPLSAIQARARKSKKSSERAIVSWWRSNWDLAGAAITATEQDVAIVFVNADSGEGYITVDGNEGDRKNLTLWGNADALVGAVAAVNRNTVVVAHSVGPAIIEPWVEHPNVTAVVWAGIPGQEAGNSIADVLFGDVNPSGRLPYTIARNASDYGAHLVTGGDAAAILSIPYTEGLLIDYRWFDAVSELLGSLDGCRTYMTMIRTTSSLASNLVLVFRTPHSSTSTSARVSSRNPTLTPNRSKLRGPPARQRPSLRARRLRCGCTGRSSRYSLRCKIPGTSMVAR